MAVEKLNLAVLISGNGSNLQALIDACTLLDFPARVAVVISNRPGAYGLERAAKAGIPAITLDHKSYTGRSDFEDALQSALSDYPVDLICLAGFMRILTADFINRWPNKIINTHPALLPKFGGKGMYGEHVHTAVLAAGERISGCSIHYVIPEVDQGPVILQKTVPVEDGDSIETLAARVIAQEHIAYPEAVRMIAEKRA
ncbi:MAG: phosphoribosylglycinamide formyltransferase [Rhodospirillales bacterium]|nr:phosphoribosylglycinamide formyltransferase [Rhodospirillales bacterium]